MVVLMLCYSITIMDPTWSRGMIGLGKNVHGSSSEKVEGHEDWDAPEYTDIVEAYDGEINLALDENLISNEYVVKLCLDCEVKNGKKVVKKELIVSLKGEHYFVKFIINPKEDDVEPEDSFEDDSEKIEKSMDDWDQLHDFNFEDIPQLDGEELSSLVCKMGKSNRNKKRAMCDTRDLTRCMISFEVFDHLILSEFMFG
nr:hypothetical protein [Tanacetum cinerariifolium]